MELRCLLTKQHGDSSVLRPEVLKDKFSLSDIDLRLLCAVASPQISNRVARLYRFATGLETTVFPASFYAELLGISEHGANNVLRRLESDMPLSKYLLIEIGEQSDWGNNTPLLHAPLFVSNRITNYLLGIDNSGVLKYGKIITPEISKERTWLSDENATRIRLSLDQMKPRVGIYGPRGTGRFEFISEIAAFNHRKLITVNLSTLLNDIQLHILLHDARRWIREAQLLDAIIVLIIRTDIDAKQERVFESFADYFQELVHDYNGAILLIASSPHPRFHRLLGDHVECICEQPLQSAQAKYWTDALSNIVDDKMISDIVAYVSNSYCLTPREINETVRQVVARCGGLTNCLNGDIILDTIRSSRGRELEGLADLKPTPVGINSIVLNQDIRNTVDDILRCAQYADMIYHEWGFSRLSSSSGINVLFTGGPGTGKTLTACAIAHELKRALYIVDISRVVDKYIGETEKRLAQIFNVAQRSQAILLFDEADSLFAKRTDVKSSHDRYANLEVNYLLQRLETYRGVVILTTNLATSLDDALERRIQFKVEFPMPKADERAKIWQTLMPHSAPCDLIDFESLGEHFEMSGGHIKNAIFRACIMAASQNRCIDTEMLWQTCSHEYRSLGHAISDLNRELEQSHWN